MDESRTWHAGKPKKKPDYNPESITQELLDAAVSAYGDGDEKNSLREVVAELEAQGYGSFNPAKVKKLLITAKVYSTPTTEEIRRLREQGNTIEQIMALTGLSRAAVNNNLPYEKIVYKLDEAGGDVSVNADRVRLYKKRKKAVEALQAAVMSGGDISNGADVHIILWDAIVAFENYPLKTASGLDFSYTFKSNRRGEKGNEILVSRKEKTITKSSVEMAFDKVMEKCQSGEFPVKMSTPKELGVFGASYIYPVFIRFGLIKHIGKSRQKRKKTCY